MGYIAIDAASEVRHPDSQTNINVRGERCLYGTNNIASEWQFGKMPSGMKVCTKQRYIIVFLYFFFFNDISVLNTVKIIECCSLAESVEIYAVFPLSRACAPHP